MVLTDCFSASPAGEEAGGETKLARRAARCGGRFLAAPFMELFSHRAHISKPAKRRPDALQTTTEGTSQSQARKVQDGALGCSRLDSAAMIDYPVGIDFGRRLGLASKRCVLTTSLTSMIERRFAPDEVST